MRGCVTGFLLGVLFTVGVLVAAYLSLAQPPARLAEATPVPVSGAAARRFDEKLATIEEATAPTTVEFTDAEATSRLVEALAASPDAPRVEGAQVAFRDGKVYLSGTSRDTPLPVRVLVTGRIEAQDGRLVPTVEQIDTGRFPAPDPLKRQITDAATNLDALNDGLPIYVTDVRVLDGRLAVTGRPK